jgi:hypothetical protein
MRIPKLNYKLLKFLNSHAIAGSPVRILLVKSSTRFHTNVLFFHRRSSNSLLIAQKLRNSEINVASNKTQDLRKQ